MSEQVSVPKAALSDWLNKLEEISGGSKVKVTTSHTDNVERAYEKNRALAAGIISSMNQILGR